MSCHGKSVLKHNNQGSFCLNSWQISGYFDTKITALVQIEPILHKFQDQKIAHFLKILLKPETLSYQWSSKGRPCGVQYTNKIYQSCQRHSWLLQAKVLYQKLFPQKSEHEEEELETCTNLKRPPLREGPNKQEIRRYCMSHYMSETSFLWTAEYCTILWQHEIL